VSVKFSDQLINVGSDVIMEPNIRLFLNFSVLELFAKLFHSVLILSLLRSLYILDNTSCEISTVNLSIIVLEHQKFKSEKLLYDVSSELYHVF